MNKKLLSVLALSLLLVGCQTPATSSPESNPSEEPSTPSVENSEVSSEAKPSSPSETVSPEPVLPEQISVSGNVSNLVDGNLSGVAVKYNGNDVLTDNDGNFAINTVADYI